MATVSVSPEHQSTFGALLFGIADTFSLALRYKSLFEMNDEQLAARGMSRADLNAKFIEDAGRL